VPDGFGLRHPSPPTGEKKKRVWALLLLMKKVILYLIFIKKIKILRFKLVII